MNGVVNIQLSILLLISPFLVHSFPIDPNPVYSGDFDIEFAMNFLFNFGYLKRPLSIEFTDAKELTNSILKFQTFAGLPCTGMLDEQTLMKMSEPRCGVPDYPLLPNKGRINKRYSVIDRWPKTEITFKFDKISRDLSFEKQRDVITKAFAVWSQQTPLSFTEGFTGDEDIMISFQRGFHNDGYPFDGSGHTLAHAFFPGQGKRSGDVHFDEDEDWSLDSNNGTDLFKVSTHEIGHALGLGHSTKLNSVMLPFYQGNKDVALSKDDRDAINELYGSMAELSADVPRKYEYFLATKPPFTDEWWNEGLTQDGDKEPNEPNVCFYDFDAIANIRNEMYFIKGDRFWRVLTRTGKLFKTDGTPMSTFWTQFPKVKVDAAYQRPDGKIVFFTGNQFYVYVDSRTKEAGYPRPISDYGLPTTIRIDAVMVWSVNSRTYFFSGDQFWKYDEYLRKLEPGYPKKISDNPLLNGIPSNLDAALTNPLDGKTYFVKGDQCWQYDNEISRVNPDYPKYIGEQWFDCDATMYNETSTTAATHKLSSVRGNTSPSKAIHIRTNYYFICLSLILIILS